MNDNHFIKNLFFAFSAQAISLILNMIMYLIVPKVLGVSEYSYWQLFIFYGTYIGFFHFGLNDGIYLKLGGKRYEEIDKKVIGSQFKIGFMYQSIICIGIIIYSIMFVNEYNREFVLICTGIYMLVCNLTMYLGFVFQAINETKLYSISIILDKVFFLTIISILLFLKVNNFKVYIELFLLCKIVAFIYCLYKGREMVFTYNIKFTIALKETIDSIKIGISLILASISNQFILGSGRIVIDNKWGIEVFGKFSFAISLTSFILLFISDISMVLFPTLRRASSKEIKKIYILMKDGLNLLLPFVLLLYIPIKTMLTLWLPEYKVSLAYMALLLPLCNFNGKMNLICATYFKVLRKEKYLLKINILTMILSVILSIIGGYIFNNIYFIIISMVFVTAFRSIASELYLSKLMNVKITNQILQECVLIIIFMISSWYLSEFNSFIIFFISYSIYIYLNKNKIEYFIEKINNHKIKSLQ
ncbi:oligosaccharide flippase family protein [Clostridium butyricum]|uniref:oligosaccharide flippase family protein n=1 Tax=Clostridium butyricum TaxID=1492 RepID=UPI003467AD3C